LTPRQNLRAIADMARHDPLAILGFCLIGAGAVLSFHMYRKMSRAGFNVAFGRFEATWRLPGQYLYVRKEQGWSPWPAYLVWPCHLLGLIALVAGLFLLRD